MQDFKRCNVAYEGNLLNTHKCRILKLCLGCVFIKYYYKFMGPTVKCLLRTATNRSITKQGHYSLVGHALQRKSDGSFPFTMNLRDLVLKLSLISHIKDKPIKRYELGNITSRRRCFVIKSFAHAHAHAHTRVAL